MSFLPEWMSQGVTGDDSNGNFGTAAMFERMQSQLKPGEWDFMKNFKLADILRGGMGRMGQGGFGMNRGQQVKREASMPNMNQNPSFTPYQTTPIGPDMNNVQGAYGMSPNGQIMPNWNRKHGGY